MSHIKADNKSSIEAASEAIAKVNAILIAKGKLKPSQLNSGASKKTSGSMNNLITAEVEINDVPIGCRNLLTRGTNQEEISKMSGAAVATRGRYMTAEDRARNPHERALYLSIQASSQEAVDLACGRIREIIANGISRQGPKTSRFSPAAALRGVNPRGPRPAYHNVPPPLPQPLMQVQTQNVQVFQEKLYVGLEHAPPNFNVKDKILGPGVSFLQHVQSETGAKVSLRGKGSGFIEMNGQEAPEPMHLHIQHVSMMGLQQAKELGTNLIQTVQQEYAAFQQSFVTMPPPNVLPQQTYMVPPPPQLVSLAQPPPLLPGQQLVSVPVSSMGPPTAPVLQAPPQTAYIQNQPGPGSMAPGMPAPGVVLPQLSTSVAPVLSSQPPPVPGHMLQPPGQPLQQFPPPASAMGPPPGLQHVVQTSEQQVLGGQTVSSQILVSASPSQPSGQTVVYTVGGQSLPAQPHNIQVSQVPQQLGPPGSVQLPQHQQLNMPPQQAGLQQQILQQQMQIQPPGNQQFGPPSPQHQHPAGIQLQQQQPNMMQNQASSQPQFVQQLGQPTLQLTSSIPQVQQQQQQQPQQLLQQPQQPPPTLNQQQLPPMGSQLVPSMMPPAVSWSGTQPNYSSSAPALGTMPGHQPVGFHQPALLQNTTTSMVASSPQSGTTVVMATSTPTPVSSAPSQYVYHTGPREEPKRRFSETKPDDQVPENLLGYEHGPPHLANMVVQPNQPQNHQAQQHQSQQQHQQQHHQQQQQHVQPAPGTSPVPASDPGAQPQLAQQGYSNNQLVPQNIVASQGGTIPQSQLHVQQLQQQQQQQQQLQQFQNPELARSEADIPKTPGLSPSPGPQLGYSPTPNGNQHMMPPPPPPGMKREADPSAGGPEHRKKVKGQSTDEDDDLDIPSSMANQAKELKKYSFNQYSNSPQLYTKPETSPGDQFTNTGFLQQPYPEQGTIQPGQNVPGTIMYDQYGNQVQPQPGSHPIPTENPAGRPLNGEPVSVQNEAESPQYQSAPGGVDHQNKGQQFYPPGMTTAPAPSPPVLPPPVVTSGFQHYQPGPPLVSQGFAPTDINNSPIPFNSQPPPPPPLMEDPGAAGRDEGPGGRRRGPVFVHYGRREEPPAQQFQQPPPPPPPPRSYW